MYGGRKYMINLCTFHSILQWTKSCSEKSSLLWKHLVRWEVITMVTATIYGCWALEVYQQHCSSRRLLLACSILSQGFIKMRIVLLSRSSVQAVGLSPQDMVSCETSLFVTREKCGCFRLQVEIQLASLPELLRLYWNHLCPEASNYSHMDAFIQ